MKLAKLLNIQKGLTAIVGGGGKTTLMHTLAKELAKDGSVIITTSTHIRKSHIYENYTDNNPQKIKEALSKNGVICIGSDEGEKFSTPEISFDELTNLADYVIVEADGSKQLPIKAHAEYEPVIPEISNQTIYVIGIDGFGKPIKESVHRPQIYTKKTGTKESDILTPKIEAKMRELEGFGDRFFINKVESENDKKLSKELASYLKKPVAMGSLNMEEYECL